MPRNKVSVHEKNQPLGPVQWGIALGLGLSLSLLVSPVVTTDPLGAFDGLGHSSGQIINVQLLSLAPTQSPTPSELPPAWLGQPLSLA